MFDVQEAAREIAQASKAPQDEWQDPLDQLSAHHRGLLSSFNSVQVRVPLLDEAQTRRALRLIKIETERLLHRGERVKDYEFFRDVQATYRDIARKIGTWKARRNCNDGDDGL